jgi:hypothetical protein
MSTDLMVLEAIRETPGEQTVALVSVTRGELATLFAEGAVDPLLDRIEAEVRSVETADVAKAVVTAIAKGEVPHVRVVY